MTDQRATEPPFVRVVSPTALLPDEPYRLVTRPVYVALVGEGTPMTHELGDLLNDIVQRRRRPDSQ